MPLIPKLARDTRDIVIADERLRHERLKHRIVPPKRLGKLEQVAIVQRAPDRLT
jgi:hypothetical protein